MSITMAGPFFVSGGRKNHQIRPPAQGSRTAIYQLLTARKPAPTVTGDRRATSNALGVSKRSS